MGEIRIAKLDDLEFIYKLWCKNSKTLGIVWRGMIKEDIEKQKIYIIDNVGFCRFNVMKRKPVVKINGIAIVETERNKGFGSKFINKLMKFERPIILECVEGADNNHFYKKFGRCYGQKEKQNITLLKFVINEGKEFNNEW